MRTVLSLAVTGAIAAACGACAQTTEPVEPAEPIAGMTTERGCFSVRRVNGYSEAPDGPGGRDRLYINVGVNERWLGETFGACPDLDWSQRIGFDTRMQPSLCTGETATLLVPSSIPGPADRCTVRILGRMVE